MYIKAKKEKCLFILKRHLKQISFIKIIFFCQTSGYNTRFKGAVICYIINRPENKH